MKRLRKEKDELASELQVLEAENKNYIDALVKMSHGEKISVVNYKTSRNNHSPNRKFEVSKAPTANKEYGINPTANGKTISLRQLKEFIGEIYESKFKFDQKLGESRQSRQTMY